MKLSFLRLQAFGLGVILVLGLLSRGVAAPAKTETAVLAAGCFWCMEAIFEQQSGVLNVVSGFAGGTEPNPTYAKVCTEMTGYAESIEITFDPAETSFETLLALYWRTFDATDGRGVAPDFGSSYRPVIFYENSQQQKLAETSKAAEAKRLGQVVATEILPLTKFWPAEEYHQDYVKNNPGQPYVRSVSYERMDRVGAKHE